MMKPIQMTDSQEHAMRQAIIRAWVGIPLSLFALSSVGSEDAPAAVTAAPGAAGSGLAVNTAVISVGADTWTFSMSGSPGTMCKTKMLGNKDGITAMGTELGPDGAPLPRGARLEMNVYPEDWTPRGTQSHSIKIIGPGDDADWNTATPTLIKKNPEISDLTRAVVHDWSFRGGWAAGTATFYLKDSLSRAQTGGDLVLVDGSFEVSCSP
jgi:hypothetical protein